MWRTVSFFIVGTAAYGATANYFAAPGLWGIENPVVFKKATRSKKAEVPVSRKSIKSNEKTKLDEVEYVNLYFRDELDEAEDALYRAVEYVEKVVVHALDDEVETLFPHKKRSAAT